MRSVRTEDCDLELHLPGGGGVLPARRINAYDPDRGETPEAAHQAVLTTWQPDDGERKALANGAPLQLVVHANVERQPPVSLHVGEPPEGLGTRLLTFTQAQRAAEIWWAAIAQRWLESADKAEETGQDPAEVMPGAQEVLDLWAESLQAAATEMLAERLVDERNAGATNGNGHPPEEA